MGGEGAALAVLGGILTRGGGMIAVIYRLQGLLLVTFSQMSFSVLISSFLIIYGLSL